MSVTTTDQQRRALARGNEVKNARADLRRRLRSGELTLADALEDPTARDMSVWHLVRALKGFGESKTIGVAIKLERRGASIHYGKRVRTLTVRQRLALLAAVAGAPCRPPQPPKARPPKHAPKRPQPAKLAPASFDASGTPPRCPRCKIRLQQPAELCGFCAAEQAEAA